MPLQVSDGNCLLFVKNYIGNQSLVTRYILTSNDYSLPYIWMLAKHCLDLTQFDTKPTQFYLMVEAS